MFHGCIIVRSSIDILFSLVPLSSTMQFSFFWNLLAYTVCIFSWFTSFLAVYNVELLGSLSLKLHPEHISYTGMYFFFFWLPSILQRTEQWVMKLYRNMIEI